MTRLLFVAPFPPRFSGQTISSQNLAQRLERNGFEIQRCDTGLRNISGKRHKLARIVRLIRTAAVCLISRSPVAYISVSANRGMWVTGFLAGLARVNGKHLFLHHHTNAHLNTPRRSMRWLLKMAGKEATHIVICDIMASQLVAQYGNDIKWMSLSNIGVVAEEDEGSATRRIGSAPFIMGHLSNLSEEKGCLRVIDAFYAAQSAGLARFLVLAGPIAKPALRLKIEESVNKSNGAIKYLGPVYGNEKVDFFNEIDVFLFPTRYPNETQGIVNLEALASGVPVAGYAMCCMQSDLDDPSCALVSLNEDFTGPFLSFLERLADAPEQMSLNARARFDTLVSAGEAEFFALCQKLRE